MTSDELSESEYLIVRTYWDRAVLKASGVGRIGAWTVLPALLLFAAAVFVALRGPHHPQSFALLLLGFGAVVVGLFLFRRMMTREFNSWLAPLDHAELPALCAKIGAHIKEWSAKRSP